VVRIDHDASSCEQESPPRRGLRATSPSSKRHGLRR